MASIHCILSCALLLAALPHPVTSAAMSAEIFPSLRRHRAAALQIHTTMQPVPSPDNEEPEATSEVPAAADVGSDGFPQLPPVSQMLSSASGTLKTVNSQAGDLQARVGKAQLQVEAKLAKEKAAFEEKLKQQEANNRMIIAQNANITSEIKKLQSGNADIKKNSHEVEAHSRLMRSQLHTLESHLGIAKTFISKSEASTDDSKNSLLDVLHNHPHKHVLVQTTDNATKGAKDDDDDDDTDDDEDSNDSQKSEDKDDDDDSDDDDSQSGPSRPTSFLSISNQVKRAPVDAASAEVDASELAGEDSLPGEKSSDPQDLLAVLSQEVTNLAKQEKESSKKLKDLFIKAFKAGAQRKQALLKQQKTLMASRNSLLSLQSDLKKAEAHVEGTRDHLRDRLYGLGRYIQKLAHVAMAPSTEVPHLLEVLPKAVAIKHEKAL